jgi:hypothetical protein
MTMTAYATPKIEPHVLAAAVLVMEAWRGQEETFPAVFDSHPAITATPEGEGYKFTANMNGLMSPVAFGLNRHGGQPQILSLSTGKPVDEQIAKALNVASGPVPPGKGGLKPGV